MKNAGWRKLSGAQIAHPIAEEVKFALTREKAMGHDMKVCIGTDSQVKGRVIEFATVIVLIRKGKGGFMYIRTESCSQQMPIRQRMLTEVAKTVEVANDLSHVLRDGNGLELHVDINTSPDFKSNESLKEAMGYVLGMGFVFKAKPHAFASSCCANKMVQ